MHILLEAEVDVNYIDADGATALKHAAGNGHYETVKILLEAGADINAQNNSGYTALMSAVLWGHLKTVELLVEKGANLNLTNSRGLTALQIAEHVVSSSYSFKLKQIIELLRLYSSNDNV